MKIPQKRLSGLILYEGPSLIDGKPIVAIITNIKRKSKNLKTGKSAQVFILRSDIHPCIAFKTGEDYSVCFNCKHRIWKTCYVDVSRSVTQVYLAYKRGSYPYADLDNIKMLENKVVRLGSYGDPSVISTQIWDIVASVTKRCLGYTHNWKNCNKELKNYCMASVDSIKEYRQAKLLGWRTFRIRYNNIILENEKMCMGGKRGVTCSKCLSCCGIFKNGADRTVLAHGTKYKIERLQKIMVR
jgi:hypothetical protein